jgi:hypothetical protein
MVDTVVAVAVGLWVSAVMPDGSFYLMGHDVFMPYVLAVVVLWTTLRGPRTGVVLLAGVAVLELVMGLVNGVPLDAVAWPEFLNRFATACLAVALPLVVMAAAAGAVASRRPRGSEPAGKPSVPGCCETPMSGRCTPLRRS